MSFEEDLLDWLEGAPDERVLIEEQERRVTGADLKAWTASLAGALVTRVAPGERFAVCGKNRAEIVAALLAARWIGAVVVTLNHHLKPPELAWQIEDADARVVLLADHVAPQLAEARVARGDRTAFWCFDPLDDVDAIPAAVAPSRAPTGHDAPLVQMYTSGTTGRPKGAVLCERNLVALVRSWAELVPLDAHSRILQVTPLFHIGAVTQALSSLAMGATLLLHREFTPTAALRALRDEGVTHALLVPAMIRWILIEKEAAGASFPALEVLIYGAAPMPPTLAAEARRLFACDWFQGYGLTETTGVLTALLPADHEVPERLSAAGRALSCCEVRVVGPDDVPLPPGEVGEVVARGANVALGYHARPEATAEAWRGGWFHTGDVGRLDADGLLFLVDRLKDMILVGGENVYSREVEVALEAHPAVREVAVIGVPHEVWGEAVTAFVAPREPVGDAAAFERSLVRHCRSVLARYKCPTRVVLAEALPRNAAGKVRKDELRAPFWAGRDRGI
ncbi:MAG: AMP-binding protein [Alphaproteobacteria bacterium]|nr:AMP-binding protein [Alphaproteobacteria bacterium]MCB9696238.1 AMP-binding protein [Alphaproteobacteria bacterium]